MIVGTVVALRRYPVKSMRAEPLDRAEVHWVGLAGDRSCAFVKDAGRPGFPWLTGRDVPALLLHEARYLDPADPGRSRVRVLTPDGAAFDAHDPALAARLSAAAGETVRPIRIARGAFDAMPVSVLTTALADRVARAHGDAVSPGRFRANVVIETLPGAPPETEWTGASLAFGGAPGGGDARVRADWPIPRCAMVTLDPDTAAKDPSVLRTVARRFGNEVGLYCAVERPGTIAVGAEVRLVR